MICHIIKPSLICAARDTLNQQLDHDYYQYNKDSSALQDPTCNNTNFSDLEGGLVFYVTTWPLWYVNRLVNIHL